MVRTADTAARVTGGKASRKAVTARPEARSRSPSTGPDRSGLNPVCPRETPGWQKPITNFFQVANKSKVEKTGDVQMKEDVQVKDDVQMVDAGEGSAANGSEEVMEEAGDDKENEPGKSTDGEMQELSGSITKKCKARDDDDEEMQPAKRVKMDESIYRNLQNIEKTSKLTKK